MRKMPWIGVWELRPQSYWWQSRANRTRQVCLNPSDPNKGYLCRRLQITSGNLKIQLADGPGENVIFENIFQADVVS
jgi:hypothetical protein